jgi:hypothetical protein
MVCGSRVLSSDVVRRFVAVFAVVIVSLAGCRARSVASVPRESLPAWTLEDCVERDGVFYVTGVGAGTTRSDAGRSASRSARRSAVMCVFGASFVAELRVDEQASSKTSRGSTETSGSSSVAERSRQSVSVEAVDWQGFELVPGRILTLDEGDAFRVHAQYGWRRDAAMQAKVQAQKLEDAAERSRALQAQSEAQSRIIHEQQSRLATIEAQERELQAVRDRTEAAARRIADLNRAQQDRNGSIKRVVEQLYCGVTFRDVVASLGPPEEWGLDDSGVICTFFRGMRWAEYWLVEESSSCFDSPSEAKSFAMAMRISGVRMKFGSGQTAYLCR